MKIRVFLVEKSIDTLMPMLHISDGLVSICLLAKKGRKGRMTKHVR